MTGEEEEAVEETDNESFFHDDTAEETEDLIKKKSSRTDSIPIIVGDPIITYKKRWLMLFIFSLNTAMNGCLFMMITPINDVVRRYYEIPSVGIEWLSNMCVLTYIALAMPASFLISRWGIRPVLFTAAGCNFIGTALHFSGYTKERFYLVVLGQAFVAIAYSTILQMPGKLSSLWFPENERATATSIGVVMNLFGVAIGFLEPSLMVRVSPDMGQIENDLKIFYIAQLVMASVILLLTLFYEEKPPTPPCRASERECVGFLGSMKLLWRNKHFVSLSQSYGIYFGLFVAIFVLVNPLVTSVFRTGYEIKIGWMGFWNNIVAMFSFVFIGLLLDRFHKYQLTAVLLNLTSMILWLVFVVVLTNTKQFDLLYVIYVLLGLCFVPYFAVGIEQAAEMTYPVSEEISSSVILVLGNVYAFILIIALGVLAQSGYVLVVGYLMVGMYAVATLLASLAKTDLNRLISEKSSP